MEKRDQPRSKKRVMIRYGQTKADRTAFTKDVSARGIQLKTNNVFSPGTTVLVELSFTDRTFTTWAKVRWAKKVPPQLAHVLECGMGLEFIDPPPDWFEYFASWSGTARRA